jgi:hypothetical protein
LERFKYKLFFNHKLAKLKDRLRSNRGEAGFKSIMILLIGLIVVLMFFQAFTWMTIMLSARDTLDRAVLSSASKAMESPMVYYYLREESETPSGHDLSDECLNIMDVELKEVLQSDLGLTTSDYNNFVREGYYTLEIKDENKKFYQESLTFEVKATVYITVKSIGNTEIPLHVDITSTARYADINEDYIH